MDNLSFLLGLNANAGGSGSTPSWSNIEGKPFNTIGAGLRVDDNGNLREVVPVYTETTENWESMSFYDLTNLGSNHFSYGLTDAEASVLPATGFDVYFYFSYKTDPNSEDVYSDEFSASLGETHIWDSTYVYENDEWQFNIYLANEDGVKLNIIGQKKNDTADIISISSCILSYIVLGYIDHTLPGKYVAKDDSTIKANLEGNLYVDTTTILSGYATEDYVDSKVSQSDWAQSITTAPDYVKNRPMYSYQEEGQGERTDTFPGIDYCMAVGSNCKWFSAVAMVVESNVNSSNINCSFEYSWLNGEDTTEIVDTFTIPQNADIWNTVTVTGDVTGYTYDIWVGLDEYDNDILNITCNATGEYNGDTNNSLSLTYQGTTYITKYHTLSPVYVPIDDETIKADANDKIYVPITPNLTTGVDIASIGGVTIYAPAGGGSQADWAETDTTDDSYIQNKPTVRAGTGIDSLIFNSVGVGSNQATGSGATAFGNGNTAGGMCSFVVGSGNYTDSNYSVVEGTGNTQVGDYGHTQGKYKYNWPWINSALLETDVADSIGNGTSSSNRSCAEVTTWTGNKYLAGDVYVGVTNWATPTIGSAKIPKEADINYAISSGEVIDYYLYEDAVSTYEDMDTDSQGHPEYLGVNSSFTFHCSLNELGEKRYFWVCDTAEADPNPEYSQNEPAPEEEPEEP